MPAESGAMAKEPLVFWCGSHIARNSEGIFLRLTRLSHYQLSVYYITCEKDKKEKNWMAVFNLDLEAMGICVCICNSHTNGEMSSVCTYRCFCLGLFLLLSCCLSALFMHYTTF